MSFRRSSLFLTHWALAVALCWASPVFAQSTADVAAASNPNVVVYKGDTGTGAGKHIVFIAGDHEYRSEETLPMLARIMARHYGFTCSVFFTTNPQTGEIDPESSHITGLAALDTADLLVIFTRFKDFPDAEMKHVVDYLNRGGPVVGLRTATHAFQIQRADAAYAKYSWKGTPEYVGGFGRQILGETWVSHYGANHKQSSRLVAEKGEAGHPILRGVKDAWVKSGGYTANPIEGSHVLATGEILDGMTPDSPPAQGKTLQPVAWYRTYTADSGKQGRAFATTHGASEDIVNDGFRRLMVNAILWGAGLESTISPDGPIALVGPYHPTTYAFKGFIRGMKPSDFEGWDSAIPKR